MKYDLEETIIRASSIFDYAKQELTKYKLAKQELDNLNNPISFFNSNTSNISGGSTTGAINIGQKEANNKSGNLNYSRVDGSNVTTGNVIGRTGSSQQNEDYDNIEEHWKEEDKKYTQIDNKKDTQIFDINIPKDSEEIDLNKAIVESTALKLDTLTAPEEKAIEAPTISYTGINLNKSLSTSTAKNTTANKAVTKTITKNKDNSVAINTSTNTNKSNTLNISYVYGDATYKALGLYVSNFKESFFNSFSTLFIESWDGY